MEFDPATCIIHKQSLSVYNEKNLVTCIAKLGKKQLVVGSINDVNIKILI